MANAKKTLLTYNIAEELSWTRYNHAYPNNTRAGQDTGTALAAKWDTPKSLASGLTHYLKA